MLLRPGCLLGIAVLVAGCKAAPDTKQAEAPPLAPAAGHEKLATPDTPHWDYGSAEGPRTWGGLSKGFAACSAGKSQSPIDIATSTRTALTPASATHQALGLHVMHAEHLADGINTGHTIQVNYGGADTLVVGDDRYALVQYHFHSPSEHTVKGTRFPMEMHLVHRSAEGRLAVIGVLMTEGKTNAALAPVWSNLPRQKGYEVKVPNVTVDVDELLPTTLTTYRYEGSLTTPPCSEGVRWLVMTTPVEVGPEQVAAFRAIVKDNNRPVQGLNGRVIATDLVDESS